MRVDSYPLHTSVLREYGQGKYKVAYGREEIDKVLCS